MWVALWKRIILYVKQKLLLNQSRTAPPTEPREVSAWLSKLSVGRIAAAQLFQVDA